MAKRIEKWDILKFILILTVVLGHFADFYTGKSELMRHIYLFIYTFHMPLFIFVSGLFSKRTVNEMRFEKIAGYLVVYLFTKLAFALYVLIAWGKFELELFDDGGLPWFMFAMFAFPLITYCVRKVKFPIVLAVSVAVALIVGYFRCVGTVLSLSRIIVYFPFFYVGYIIKIDDLQRFTDNKKVKIASAVFLILLAVAIFGFGENFYFLRSMFTGKNSYYSIKQHFYYAFVFRLLCYVISAAAGFAVIALTPNNSKVKLVTAFGARTLSVYVYHNIVLYIIYYHIGFKNVLSAPLPWWALLVMIPISVGITLLLSLNIFYKPLEYMMNLPSTIKQKINARS
ncbi:MAG: acyltransferase family protein [Clostridia bacterium]|nr:acyltransferase family protein [Clostridia bacterium]